MKDLITSGRELFIDLLSTIFFVALYAVTRNVLLAVALGMAVAAGQIALQLYQGKKVVALQWVSLALVAASGSATLITENPIFVMLKPSALYLLVGASMLQRGWMNRYMPERALEYVPDLAICFGYVWAGLMFVTAALNLVLAMNLSVVAWGAAMTLWGLCSKFALFFLQFGVMKFLGHRRARNRQILAA